ncbi:unnamed protein product, partial [marine sediment metagenome]
ATTRHNYAARHADFDYYFHREDAAFDANAPSELLCDLWLDPEDVIRVAFDGGQAGDTCRVGLLGHRMTLET